MTINLIDNSAVLKNPDIYIEIEIDTIKILKSWKTSLRSFEWLDKKGNIKPITDLNEQDKHHRQEIENALKNGQNIPKSILGIGVYDNIEIGSNRAEFLTLTAHGQKTLPVHVRKSQEQDFQPFRTDVN